MSPLLLPPLLFLSVGCAPPDAEQVQDTAEAEDWAAAAAEEDTASTGATLPTVATGASGELVTVSLVDPEAWIEVSARLDPFQDRPALTRCSPLGYGEENDTFEVNTLDCAYGTFRQPILHDVPAGTEILVIYWFLELWSVDADAEGHVALALDDGLLLEEHIPIPGGPETRKLTVEAPRDLAEGEWLYFHVHNHGYNSWSLGYVQADVPS